MTDLATLNKPELLHLVRRVALFIDQRDVANARWEAAEADAERLWKIASGLEDNANALAIECIRARKPNYKKLYQRDQERISATKAHATAARARRRADRRWKELQAHFMKDAK